jgi:S-ribosylhomocysteine lyase
MGCRTGFYWIVQGDKTVNDVIHTIIMLLSYVINSTFIPGATEVECGNYRDMDLDKAIKYAENYLKIILSIE